MRVERRRARETRLGGFGCLTALISLAVVLTAAAAVTLVVSALAPSGGSASAARLHHQGNAIPWNGGQATFLIDLRAAGGAGHDDLFLASLSPQRRRAAVLALPENLWVTIPGFGQGELGQAYDDGGPSLALRTVESITGVAVPYYLAVDASTTAAMIDSAGGLALRVPADPAGLRPYGLAPGLHHLDGATSLRFLRHDPSASSDEGARLRRSTLLLRSLATTLAAPGTLYRVPALIDSYAGSMITDFPYGQLTDLVRVAGRLPATAVTLTQLDSAGGTLSPYNENGQGVLLGDWSGIRAIAHRLVPATAPRAPGIEVLNGDGVLGQAAALGNWLQDARLPVAGESSAPSYTYPRTEILLAPGASAAARTVATQAATLLQIPVRRGRLAGHHAPVLIIIGRDYQDPNQV